MKSGFNLINNLYDLPGGLMTIFGIDSISSRFGGIIGSWFDSNLEVELFHSLLEAAIIFGLVGMDAGANIGVDSTLVLTLKIIE